jgi:hypothetical protein
MALATIALASGTFFGPPSSSASAEAAATASRQETKQSPSNRGCFEDKQDQDSAHSVSQMQHRLSFSGNVEENDDGGIEEQLELWSLVNDRLRAIGSIVEQSARKEALEHAITRKQAEVSTPKTDIEEDWREDGDMEADWCFDFVSKAKRQQQIRSELLQLVDEGSPDGDEYQYASDDDLIFELDM